MLNGNIEKSLQVEVIGASPYYISTNDVNINSNNLQRNGNLSKSRQLNNYNSNSKTKYQQEIGN